jgi:peptidoglycan/xylan/chitin deacetylase (PgdA/CDA1 family)
MRDWAKKAILASRALRLAGNFQPQGAAILMYHSVAPDPSQHSDSLGGIVHSETIFRSQMEMLARDYRPLSLDDILKYLRDREELPRRSVVITFDDGYADNHEVAMPILNRCGVPATFYATVDCIENRRLPWPSRLRFAFHRTMVASWNVPSKSWTLDSSDSREAAFLAACDSCCQLSGAVQEEFIQGLERDLEISLPGSCGALMMTYDQLRELTHHGHIVGSHTMTHPNMAYLKEEGAQRELADSKQRLESQLAAPIKHFSYPCPALSPHWSQQTVDQSRAVGYETAVTTNSGLTRHGDDPLCLKRLRPTKTADGLRWNLESAFAGRAV